MRELKFRAWSIDSQKWCSRVDYNGIKEKWTGVVEVTSPEEKGKYIGEYVAEPEEIIVEQYTGLKDKNGKEIYEGDILEYTTCYYGNEKRHRKVVEWKEWDSDDFGEPHNLGYFDLSEYMGVIGNIHENGDLLGDTNVTNKEEE